MCACDINEFNMSKMGKSSFMIYFNSSINCILKELEKNSWRGINTKNKYFELKKEYDKVKDYWVPKLLPGTNVDKALQIYKKESESALKLEEVLFHAEKALDLKYDKVPDMNLDVFVGGAMSLVFHAMGASMIIAGIGAPSVLEILGGIGFMYSGAMLTALRIDSHRNHECKLNAHLSKIEAYLENDAKKIIESCE
ncbi:MAG: hypothetical protein PHS81_02360 [Candidatus Nanoarchaeia archaeon]|nr:hypothetical protein [Candidatus Nanoarchaeia archaeon]